MLNSYEYSDQADDEDGECPPTTAALSRWCSPVLLLLGQKIRSPGRTHGGVFDTALAPC